MLPFQEFYFITILTLGKDHAIEDFLSRLESGEAPTSVEDKHPDVELQYRVLRQIVGMIKC